MTNCMTTNTAGRLLYRNEAVTKVERKKKRNHLAFILFMWMLCLGSALIFLYISLVSPQSMRIKTTIDVIMTDVVLFFWGVVYPHIYTDTYMFHYKVGIKIYEKGLAIQAHFLKREVRIISFSDISEVYWTPGRYKSLYIKYILRETDKEKYIIEEIGREHIYNEEKFREILENKVKVIDGYPTRDERKMWIKYGPKAVK